MKAKAKNLKLLTDKEETIKIEAIPVERVRRLKQKKKIASIKKFIGKAIVEKVERDFPAEQGFGPLAD